MHSSKSLIKPLAVVICTVFHAVTHQYSANYCSQRYYLLVDVLQEVPLQLVITRLLVVTRLNKDKLACTHICTDCHTNTHCMLLVCLYLYVWTHKQATTELNAVCAVVGGILGQEIIKALSQKGTPANNVFLFDGTTSEGKVMHAG
jgi:hypothetical protein